MTPRFASHPGTGRTRALLALATSLGALWLTAAPAPQARAEADAAPDTAAARTALVELVDVVLEVLRRDELTNTQRRDLIVEAVDERFDFRTLSRLVLARNLKKFDADQRAEFESSFELHLSRHYGRRIDRYDDEDVEYRGERAEPRGDVTVKTRILTQNGAGIDVDYRMRLRDGQWRVIDVVIEGISLVSNFRSQFQAYIAKKGPEGLLARLAEMNASDGDEDEAL